MQSSVMAMETFVKGPLAGYVMPNIFASGGALVQNTGMVSFGSYLSSKSKKKPEMYANPFGILKLCRYVGIRKSSRFWHLGAPNFFFLSSMDQIWHFSGWSGLEAQV